MKSTSYITHEEVRERAHQIWENSGRPEGRDTDHWLRAEKELQTERESAAERSDRSNKLAKTERTRDTSASSPPPKR